MRLNTPGGAAKADEAFSLAAARVTAPSDAMKRFLFWGRPPDKPGDGDDASDSPDGLLTGNPREDQASIQMLLESIAEVTSGMDLDNVLDRIVRKSIQVTDAERGVVLLGSSAKDLEVRVVRDNQGRRLEGALQFSTSMVARCITEGQPVKSVVRSDQEALELGQSVFDLKLRAVMCAPLVAAGRTVGAIYVDSKAQRREFTGRDLALFGALSAQIAIAVENARLHADSLEKVRLEKEMEVAKKIQKYLLPEVPHRLRGVDFALHYGACDKTSGDTYDVLDRGAQGLVVAIGDATGHGIGASLLSHAFQATLRSYLEMFDDLERVAVRVNERMVQRSEEGLFLSMLLIGIDADAKRLHYVNAGHPELILIRDGKAKEFERTGMVLGVAEGQDYPVAGPIDLRTGDLLFLRTDGVDEAMNRTRELFGSARLLRLLEAAGSDTAAQALARVDSAVRAHTAGAPQEDDVTMMALKIL